MRISVATKPTEVVIISFANIEPNSNKTNFLRI